MLLSSALCLVTSPGALAPAPQDTVDLAPLAPVPVQRQLDWHDRRFYAFIHFGPNTFTAVEWGGGQEDPEVFQPGEMDARQWVRAFKAAGMSGVVITAKHHDGFCLWPSAVTEHDVASSSWRGGQGDVLADLSEACAAEGLWLGVYLSPWDRHEACYGTGVPYDDHFVTQLTEVLTGYGPIKEVWFDGACGEGPNGKRQVYDWPRYIATVREHQPDAVIFSDAGPDVRWCGNERAIGGETNWATLRRDEITVGTSKTAELNRGHADGTHWVPAECNTSIRPGWFWKAGLDDGVKSLDLLMETYRASVGRGGNFLLNIPPDDRGLITDTDVARLAALGEVLDATYGRCALQALAADGGVTARASNVRGGEARFGADHVLDPGRDTFWAVDDGHDVEGPARAWAEWDFASPVTFDEVWLGEPIQRGQRVERFRVLCRGPKGRWKPIGEGTTIGPARGLTVGEQTATGLRVEILGSQAAPALSRVSLYLSPPRVAIEPAGAVAVSPVEVSLTTRPGAVARYTLDGSEPTADSPAADGPVRVDRSLTLRARAFDGRGASPFPAEASYRVLGPDEWKAATQFLVPPTQGLRAKLYEGGWQTLDQMEGRAPLETRDALTFDIGLATRSEQCAIAFEGFLNVPEDGLFTFATASDDGSRLFIDGELVVDNDGLHGMDRRAGKVALRGGFHALRVEWFNSRGGAGLQVRWAGPGVGAEVQVPADALFR